MLVGLQIYIKEEEEETDEREEATLGQEEPPGGSYSEHITYKCKSSYSKDPESTITIC